MVVVGVLRIHPSEFLLEDSGSEFTLEFTERHDEQVFKCLSKCSRQRRCTHATTRPHHVLDIGRFGMTRDAAHWVSWADSLEMISGRFHRTFEDRGCQDPKLGCGCRRCETRDEEIEGS